MQLTNAVLVTLNISNWDANRQDMRVSKAVAEANEVTDQRLCRLRKSLLPKTEVMDRLFAVIRAARTFHYENTHAWMHDGPRILSTMNFDEYMRRMRGYKADFDTAVLDFLSQYEDIKADASGVLGKLYDAADYPTVKELKSRYGFEMKVQPMPALDGLLQLGLDDAEAAALRSKLEADMRETFSSANEKLWQDLFGRVEKLYGKLADEKAYVKKETLAAVKDLAVLVPRINIMADGRLEMLAQRLQTALGDVTENTLKTNPDARAKAASEVRSVYHAMQVFMGSGARATVADASEEDVGNEATMRMAA